MGKRKVVIRQFSFIWFLCFLLFFRPAFYVVGNKLDYIGRVLIQCLAIAAIPFALWLGQHGYRMKRTGIMICIVFTWCIIGSSVINYGFGREIDVNDAISTFCCVLLFILLCDIGLWYSPRKTILMFISVGIVMCSANAVTMFMYSGSGGMNHVLTEQYGRTLSKNYFLLGEDNATYFWSWPVLVMTWIYYYKYDNRFRFWIIAMGYTILLISSYLFMESMLAATACISVPIVLVLLNKGIRNEKKHKRKNRFKILQFWYFWIIGLLFDFLLTNQFNLGKFQLIIENVFHKDLTLSNRTVIWERSIFQILNSLFFGYGNEPASVSVMKISINHTHNLILETFYRGGLIGFIMLILVFVFLSIDCSQKGKQKSVLFIFLTIMVFEFLIFCSTEFAFYRYHYLILFLLMSRTDIICAENSEVKRLRRFKILI